MSGNSHAATSCDEARKIRMNLKWYLKVTGLQVGLLMNFNAPTLVVKRVVLGFKPAPQTRKERRRRRSRRA
jgi:hypothetical protein